MKNAISYYYGLSTNHVEKEKSGYRFYVLKEEFFLTPSYLPLPFVNDIFRLTLNLYQKGIYSHRIILNKEKNPITYINNIPYILLKIDIHDKKLLTLNDILNYENFTILENMENLKRNNWYEMWTQKIDYFEYQISQLGKDFSLIRESFSYFIGLAENAIAILDQIQFKEQNLVIARKRIWKNETTYDFYNPLFFILDSKIRDPSEYFKQNFYKNPLIFYDIKYYLENNNLTKEEKQLFFARMLFPTLYFDMFEEILIDKKEETILLPILKKINSYELLLKELYEYLRKEITFPSIPWLLE